MRTMETNVISVHNQAFLNSFKYYLSVEKGLSENSVNSYLTDLNGFFTFIHNDVAITFIPMANPFFRSIDYIVFR